MGGDGTNTKDQLIPTEYQQAEATLKSKGYISAKGASNITQLFLDALVNPVMTGLAPDTPDVLNPQELQALTTATGIYIAKAEFLKATTRQPIRHDPTLILDLIKKRHLLLRSAVGSVIQPDDKTSSKLSVQRHSDLINLLSSTAAQRQVNPCEFTEANAPSLHQARTEVSVRVLLDLSTKIKPRFHYSTN